MPKPSKTSRKPKPKSQRKIQPQRGGLTTKKSYWIILTSLFAISSFVSGYAMNFTWAKIALLTITLVAIIGFVGFLQVIPSIMRKTRRATFIFVGASIIGFSIWATIVLTLRATGFTSQITNLMGEQFFAVTSFATCLTIGAFIGDLIGKNRKVQARLFNEFSIDS